MSKKNIFKKKVKREKREDQIESKKWMGTLLFSLKKDKKVLEIRISEIGRRSNSENDQ